MRICPNECGPRAPKEVMMFHTISREYAGQHYCMDGWHYVVRVDETSGKCSLNVSGHCPKSAEAGAMKEADDSAMTFENFDTKYQEAAYVKVRGWADKYDFKQSNNLLISGSFGIGKTHLASAAIHQLQKRGYRTLFVRAERLLDLFGAASPMTDYRDEHADAKRLMRDIATANVVVFDDLGGQTYKQESDYFIRQFKALLDEMNGQWIVTTNSDEKQLRERLGEALMSRMRGSCQIVPMSGQDYRTRHKRVS